MPQAQNLNILLVISSPEAPTRAHALFFILGIYLSATQRGMGYQSHFTDVVTEAPSAPREHAMPRAQEPRTALHRARAMVHQLFKGGPLFVELCTVVNSGAGLVSGDLKCSPHFFLGPVGQFVGHPRQSNATQLSGASKICCSQAQTHGHTAFQEGDRTLLSATEVT